MTGGESGAQAPVLRATQPRRRDLPQPTIWLLASTSLSALLWFWVPVALVRQIDAFLAFMTPTELVRDIALLSWLLLLPSLALAICSWLAGRFVSKLPVSSLAQALLTWSIALIPLVFLCAWQFAGTGWFWLRAVTGTEFSVNANQRVVAGLLLLVCMIIAWRRWGGAALAVSLIDAATALMPLTLAALLAAGIALAIWPPRILGMSDAPAQKTGAVGSAPDVLLITIDALAGGDAAVCGDGPMLMPRLRRFAAQATCFSHAFSTSNFTTPGTASIETGVLPWTHWAVQIAAKTARPYQMHAMAHVLHEAGFSTQSLSANLLASPRHHSTDQAYDIERIADSTSLGLRPRVLLSLFPETSLADWASAIVPFLDTIDVYLNGDRQPYDPDYAYKAVPAMLDSAPAGRPRFIWVHTLPPHDPYLPPRSTKYRLLPAGELERWSEFRSMGPYASEVQPLIERHRLRYRESIMGADEALGRLLDTLERSGRLANAIVIVSSDHGESFERGFLGHAGQLVHNAVLQVPLVIKLPGQASGRVVDTPVSLADLAPTVLDLTGAAPLPRAEGRSLKPALLGQPLQALPVFAMSMERQSRFRPIAEGHYAVIDGKYKLVLHLGERRRELFDLDADPHELTDLAGRQPQVTARLEALITGRLALAEAGRKAWLGQ
jgi:arylsulfatase A-like enzyme